MVIRGFERSGGGEPSVPPVLDPSQESVLLLADGESAAVLGAPGTGKTTTIIELVADRVLNRGWDPDELVVLTSTRASATRLRDAIAVRIGVASNGPLARTFNSLAFDVVGHAARLVGAEPPRLVTGGEQDSDIAQLLEGQIESDSEGAGGGSGDDGGGGAGGGGAPAIGAKGSPWPDTLGPDVRRLRGFRSELRELMARATEYGVSAARLRELGELHERGEWVASAAFIDSYLDVIANHRSSQLDSAEFAQFAARAIASDDPGERVARLKLIVVDDLHEATESTLTIIRALARRGIAVIAFGDPDVAANAFRGGEPDALGRLGTIIARGDLRTLSLSTAHRQPPLLRLLTARVTERIGTALAGQQRAATAGAPDNPEALLTVQEGTPARLWAAVSRQLREQHVIHGVPFDRMAVIVRSGDQIAGLRRTLSLAEVPARTSVGVTALRDDRAARALLTLIDVGIGRSTITPTHAVELLTGPFGGLDRLTLRRLRLALRAEEIAGGGNRSSDELLVEGLSAPGRFATIDMRVARQADRLATLLYSLSARSAADDTIEELLWLAWESSGLAPVWFEQALSAGILATEANTALDGIVALFTSARRFVERQPDTPASVFLDAVLDADVPEDTLSPQPAEAAVFITTPSGAVGLEFDIVVVAGLQEGGWPNLRLRGSLLGPQDLVRVVTGLDGAQLDERKLVLNDELRMFALAISRARRQVILASVANDDEAPSVFLSLVPQGTPKLDVGSLPPLTLRGLTGRLRRDLLPGTSSGKRVSETDRRAAASALARLAAENVPGADPAHWHGLLEVSSLEPLYSDEEQVPVSPSKLEAFEKSPVDWFIDSVSGSEPSVHMAIGTILHWAMETATDTTVDAVWAQVDERWNELLFEAPWLADAQRVAMRQLATGIAEYLSDFRRDGSSLVGAEKRFLLEVGRADVRGSIDRLEVTTDGAVVIVDLKTGAPITNQNEVDAHPQLGVYQLAYAQGILDDVLDDFAEHHAGGAKLLYVKSGVRGKSYREGVQATLTPEQLEGFRERIRMAAQGMAAASFDGPVELPGYGGSDARVALRRVRAVSSD